MLEILIFLIVLGFIFHRSKLIAILDSVFLIIAIGYRTTGYDLYNYYLEYSSASMISVKQANFVGYYWLMKYAQKFGLTFENFVLLVAVISVLLLFVGIYRINKENMAFAYSLFLIYPFGHEGIQMRTFLADVLVLIAVSFLLKPKKNKKGQVINWTIYFIVCIYASTIHTLALFFIAIGLMYVLLPKISTWKSLLISLISYILIKQGVLSNLVGFFLTTNKLDHWLEENTSMGAWLAVFLTLVIWFLLRILITWCINNSEGVKKLYLENVLKFSELSIFIIPFFVFDITFNRLWRIFLLILYLYSGEYIYSNSKKPIGIKFFNENSQNNYIYIKIAYILTLSILLICIFIYENEGSIINSFLNYNSFFN
jgi:hypothetical protein